MENLLGLFWIFFFLSIPLAGAMIVLKMQGGAAAVMRKKRDRQIETAMRLGMYDAEAEKRIARKLLEEQKRGD